MDLERRETPGILVFRVIYPYLIYLGVSIFIQVILVFPQCMEIIENSAHISYVELMNKVSDHIYSQAMRLTALSGAVVIPILYFFYARDRRVWPVRGFSSLQPMPVKKYGYAALFGVISCLAFNHLISLLRIIEASETYTQVEQAMSQTPFIWQFLATVIVAPISEELIFRGLVYKRLRRCAKPLTCALISAAAFGITHGNLVQFVYAFIVGMLLAFVYEKYKNLWAPICFHACANGGSITLGAMLENMEIQQAVMIGLLLVELAAVYVMYRWTDKKIVREPLDTSEVWGGEDV